MHIHRGLLLVLIMAFIFSPAIQDWITNNQTAWYRPFIAWFAMICVAYWVQRSSLRKDRHV